MRSATNNSVEFRPRLDQNGQPAPKSRFYAQHEYLTQLEDLGVLKQLEPSEYVLLTAHLRRANTDLICWASQDTIVGGNPLSDTSAKRGMLKLKALGLMQVVGRKGKVNVLKFRVPMPQVHQDAQQVHHGPVNRPTTDPKESNAEVKKKERNEKQQQQALHASAHEDDASGGAAAAAFSATPLTGEPEAPPATSGDVTSSIAEAEGQTQATSVREGLRALGSPEFCDRLLALGVSPDHPEVLDASDDMLRLVLDRTEASVAKGKVGSPSGLFFTKLRDPANAPPPAKAPLLAMMDKAQAVTREREQQELADRHRPPAGTKWARHRPSGEVFQVTGSNPTYLDVLEQKPTGFGGKRWYPGRLDAVAWALYDWFADEPTAGPIQQLDDGELEDFDDLVDVDELEHDPDLEVAMRELTARMAVAP